MSTHQIQYKGMDEDTINVINEIIYDKVIDNESNSNNKNNQIISNKNDTELVTGEILSDLTRCQTQSMTNLGKRTE